MKNMSDTNTASANAASGAMWAVVTMLLVVVVVALLYFGGFFNRTQKKSIDININKPGVVLVVPGR
jgi:hypothetical protein